MAIKMFCVMAPWVLSGFLLIFVRNKGCLYVKAPG